MEPSELADQVQELLKNAKGLLSFASLPDAFLALMEEMHQNNRIRVAARAQLTYLFSDKIAELGEECALTYAQAYSKKYFTTGKLPEFGLDRRPFGLKAPVSSNFSFNASCFSEARLRELEDLLRVPAVPRDICCSLQKYVHAQAVPCGLCANVDVELFLYQDLCRCAADVVICRSCLTFSTRDSIIADLRIEAPRGAGTANLICTFKIPSCPFCKQPYYQRSLDGIAAYDNANLLPLASSLPYDQRELLVLRSLSGRLSELGEDLQDVMFRLSSSNVIYGDLPFYDEAENLLTPEQYACQIYARTAWLQENLAASFDNVLVWK